MWVAAAGQVLVPLPVGAVTRSSWPPSVNVIGVTDRDRIDSTRGASAGGVATGGGKVPWVVAGSLPA